MKKAKKFLAVALTLVMTTLLTCGCEDGFLGYKKENQSSKNEVSEVIDVIRPGESYGLSKSMAFMESDLMPTSEGDYEAVTATIEATVEPADANQSVFWGVEFVNPTSTWANGKKVTDYVTVTATSVGSTQATVTCKQPFGEQIKIICTSAANTDISASCTVDFLPLMDVSLAFGDLDINLGGKTNVTWEVSQTGTGLGGQAVATWETGSVYTIEPVMVIPYVWLDVPHVYYGLAEQGVIWTEGIHNDGYFILEDGTGANYDVYALIQQSWDMSFQQAGAVYNLDYSKMRSANFTLPTLGSLATYLQTQSNRENLTIKEGSICTVGLTLHIYLDSKGEETLRLDYKSLLNLTGFTYNPAVESLSLNATGLRF